MRSSNTMYSAVKDQVSCDLAEETVILRIDNAMYFGLNDVGAVIWRAIQQPKSVEEIIGIVMSEYDVEQGQCRLEVERLLADLCKNGLAERTRGADNGVDDEAIET